MSRWKWEIALFVLGAGLLLVEMVTAETIYMPDGAAHAVATDIVVKSIKLPTSEDSSARKMPPSPGDAGQQTDAGQRMIVVSDQPLEVPPVHEGHAGGAHGSSGTESGEACGSGCTSGSGACGASCQGSGKNCGCGGRGCCLTCCEEDPWCLFPGGPRGFEIGGWVSGGYTANTDSPPSKFNGPMTFNDRTDGQVNQVNMYIQRATDTGGCGFDIGGRIDVLYGTDHRFAMSRGLETRGDLSNRWNSADRRFYGVALPQAYVETAYDDFTVKLGHFYTIVGYESVPAPNNFFYSHPYTMQYGEPFTHTGMLASYKMTDTITLHGGFDRGWDNWEDDNEYLSSLFGATWSNGCGTSIAFAGTSGEEISPITGADDDRFMYSMVLSHEMNDRLSLVLQHDLGIQRRSVTRGSGTTAGEWYGAVGYLFYRLNCCWTLGARYEWFRDDDGTRVQGLGDANPIAGGQFAGNFFDVSLGLNYQRSPNLVVRPEVRYDWYDGNANTGSGGTRPFDDGNSNKQFTAAVDVIFSF